jgi:hypothetical protein
MEPRLAGIASAIACRPVRVERTEEIATAAFDHQNNRILVNQAAPYEAARGFVAHELGHEAYTTAKAWGALSDGDRMYGNLLEDMRINLRLSDVLFRNARTWIMATWEWLRKSQPGGIWAKSMPSMEVLYRAHGQPVQPSPWAQEAQDWLTDNLQNVLASQGVDHMATEIASLKALDAKYADQKPGKQNQPSEPPKQPTGKGPKGGKLSPNEQRKQWNEYHKQLQKHTEEKQLQEAMEKMLEQGSPFHADGEFKPCEPGEGPGAKDGFSGKTGKHQGEREFGKHTDMGRWQKVSTDAIEHLRTWRNRVADALMAEDHSARHRGLPRGRLDGSRLHHVTLGTSDRVFTRAQDTKRAVNTAIDVMIDQSGSTTSSMHYITAAAYALAEAVSRVPGVQMGLLGYDHFVCRMQPIGPSRVRMEDALCMDAGGTETDATALMSAGDLRATNAARKIIINVTDGAAAEPETKQMLADLDVEYYEIHFHKAHHADMMPKDTEDSIHCVSENVHDALDKLIHQLRIKGR